MTDAALQTSLRQIREATVKEHVDAENRHDPEATVATFSESRASYDIPAFGDAGQVPDHDAIRELFVGMFSVFPDFRIEPGPLRHGDDHVLVEVRFTGTQNADWAGIPSTGKSIRTRAAVLFEFEGDQLACERLYMDFGEIARQLGQPADEQADRSSSHSWASSRLQRPHRERAHRCTRTWLAS